MLKKHSNPKVEELAATYRRLYAEVYSPLLDQMSEVSKQTITDLEDAVDLGFLCREIEHLLDDLRKEVKARHVRIARLIALDIINQVTGTDDDPLVRGQYATGTPDVKPTPKIPRKETQEYQDLCKALGIPPELAVEGFVQFHYPKLVEYCAKLAADGKRMPKGLGESEAKITTIFRRLKA